MLSTCISRGGQQWKVAARGQNLEETGGVRGKGHGEISGLSPVGTFRPICPETRETHRSRGGNFLRSFTLAGLVCVGTGVFPGISPLVLAGGSSKPAAAVSDFNTAFNQARARFQAEPTNSVAAWQFGRACFDRAAADTNRTERASIAEEGIDACRRAIALRADSVAGHYYLGMNLGQLADTKRNLGALKLVKEMEREFRTAARLDDHFDFAGPDRNLGLLYQQAPSIISIGSRSKARQHLQRAVELAPEYPENRLNLIEAHLHWGNRSAARKEAADLAHVWSDARRKFAAPNWASSWSDWEKRRQTIRQELGQASKPLESPHQQQ